MELEFPGGNLQYSMSSELQNEFYQKMKSAVWRLDVVNDGRYFSSTAFCVDPTGILLCTHHGVTQKVGDKYIESGIVSAIQDGKKVKCEIVLLWKQFDTAVLRLKAKDLDRFDYVSFADDHFSRNLPRGMELFSIGFCVSNSLQFLRGTLTYKFEKDETDYTSLVDNEEYIFDVENSGLYKNSSCRTVAQLMPDNEYLHPHLNLIEFQYTGLTESGGQSGAPIFNSKGRLIGMHRSQIGGLVYGVPLPALKAVIDDIETGSKHYLLKKKKEKRRKKKKHRSH